jgi:hypothetical protein
MTSKVTLNILLNFVPEDEIESKIFNVNTTVLTKYLNNTKDSWSKGKFYLGGQIPMNLDEEITFSKINNVREISKQKMIDIAICNSFEMSSIYAAETDLNEIEIILKKYHEIYKLRVKKVLYMTILKSDLSNLIISYLF